MGQGPSYQDMNMERGMGNRASELKHEANTSHTSSQYLEQAVTSQGMELNEVDTVADQQVQVAGPVNQARREK